MPRRTSTARLRAAHAAGLFFVLAHRHTASSGSPVESAVELTSTTAEPTDTPAPAALTGISLGRVTTYVYDDATLAATAITWTEYDLAHPPLPVCVTTFVYDAVDLQPRTDHRLPN